MAMTAIVVGSAPAEAIAPAPATASQPLQAKFKRKNVLYGGRVPVAGSLLTKQPGRRILVQASKQRRWHTVARTKTGPAGSFHASFRPHGLGRYRMRVRLVGPVAADATAGVKASAIHARGKLTVYRQSVASWYGPGFIGGRTACGTTLGAGTMGVANKSLPCGSRVTFHYHGRTVNARVVDRGPYVSGREWDLTPAVKERLGFPSTGTVWSTR
ncbi:MAG TPA: septal ring lytic transglycosylase RlpA family protein [Thermoleophilaceae bacterium]